MSDLVKQAREALDGVTEGPWAVVGERHDFVIIETRAYGGQTIVGSSEWTYVEDDDARFIAASRALVPAMADRIEELEAKLVKAVEALRKIEASTDTREQGAIAMVALVALTGGQKDD